MMYIINNCNQLDYITFNFYFQGGNNMLANLVSWSRVSGTSKSGNEYDFIVLHCSVPRDTVDSKNLRVTGFPVEFRDVSIPASKWADITGFSYDGAFSVADFLSDHVGESVGLHYNITTYKGVDRAFISKVDFGGDFNA